MNRRKFLQSGTATMAATTFIGLPELLNAQPQQKLERKITFKSTLSKNQKKKGAKEYKLLLWASTIKNFKESSKEKRFFSLQINTYENDWIHTPSVYKFQITKVKKEKKVETQFHCLAKFVERTEGSATIPKEISKKLNFTIELAKTISYSYLNLKNASKELMAKLKPVVPASGSTGSEGCYITTACVMAKNLPDNCRELTTLRKFRDSYLANHPDRRKWVQEYYQKAPELVHRINSYQNKQEIYEYIYQNMIVKAIKMLENRSFDTAFNFYKDCTLTLDKTIK